jgi:N-methylhydantoinase B/oxoprolinase/acetone carboxylase alpha subunit
MLSDGQSVAIVTPGAGGYGPPRKRARDLVERDLQEDRISSAVAKRAYGFIPKKQTKPARKTPTSRTKPPSDSQ